MAVPPLIQGYIDRLEALIRQADALGWDEHTTTSGAIFDNEPFALNSPYPRYETHTYRTRKESDQIDLLIRQAVRDIHPNSEFMERLKTCHDTESHREVANALLDYIKAGYLNDAHDLAHIEVFSDFLETAQYLLEQTQKDAAAVIAGSAAESHLRQLMTKKFPNESLVDGRGKPHNGGYLNDQLHKLGAYDKTSWKLMSAWQNIRNDAAHGHYAMVDANHVKDMISGLKTFMTANPA